MVKRKRKEWSRGDGGGMVKRKNLDQEGAAI
jgi:hypothetical protein